MGDPYVSRGVESAVWGVRGVGSEVGDKTSTSLSLRTRDRARGREDEARSVLLLLLL